MENPVLLIDSDRSYIQALSEFLERLLFDVHMATTSSEALRVINLHAPHYIVGDPNLTDTEAVEFFLELKSQAPDTLFIIISDADRMDGIMERMHLAAFDYIKKPINSKELELSLLRAKEWRGQQRNLEMFAGRLGTLHRSTLLYHQLFDEIPCFISVQNMDFHITATNKLFKQHFGDAIGEYCYKVYKHRADPCHKCPVAKTFADGRFHTTEEVVTSKAGKQYNVITWTAPVRNEEGEISQVIEMSADITQIRDLQNHLESLGMMLGSMSHGLKGMLTALDGGVYQIETGLKRNDQPRVEKAVGMMKETVGRITKMVLNILYYAKSRELSLSEMDILDFSKTIVKTVEPLAEKKKVSFSFDASPEIGTFHIDPNWFESAIVNIIENSIDACSSSPCPENCSVRFSVSSEEDRVCFRIQDNGLGMDREMKNKIFTLFFSSKGSKGTGLGLFISNHVIKEHGGEIFVESEPGKGSIFTIYVPRNHGPDNGIKKEFYMLSPS